MTVRGIERVASIAEGGGWRALYPNHSEFEVLVFAVDEHGALRAVVQDRDCSLVAADALGGFRLVRP